MEYLEKKEIDSFPLKPKWWLRYVDDICNNWPHGEEKITKFTKHLNSQCNSIKFTIENEENNCLPFLDVLTTIMEYLEKKAIDSFPLKPKWWLRYVDDLYNNWTHGEEKLTDFTKHLNSQCDNIIFTIEKEEKNFLPFLDVLTTKRQDGSLAHQIYRKKTHTDRYLHAECHHHPA